MSIPHLFSVAAVVLASFAAPAASSGPGEDEDRLSGADLSAWREKTGAWRVVADVGLDPRDERRLAGKAGAGAIVNGADGDEGRAVNLFSRKEYADVEAHLEFLVPRGSNSGVYFMGRYEIQVLDSWDAARNAPKEKVEYSDCGGIYQRWDPRRGAGKEGFEGHAPRVGAAKRPGEWQSFDVVFRAPRFDAAGKRTAKARFVSVLHNGRLIHRDVELEGPTRAAAWDDEVAAGPLMLQGDHGPVAYRNVRLRPIDEAGFVAAFDGRTLAGWHVSAQTGHSAASGHRSGGRWVAEDGAITGSQDVPGNGGIILTDRQFGDFEVILEMKNDYGPDSGLFLRSTEKGAAYQYLVDYHAGGNLAGLYGEGIDPGFHVRNFTFGDAPEKITPDEAPTALPVAPADWPLFWKHGEWNELHARIEGNPPRVTTWINGVRFMEWNDPQKRHPDKGMVALQVHGGGDLTKQFVRYRKIRVREIPPKS